MALGELRAQALAGLGPGARVRDGAGALGGVGLHAAQLREAGDQLLPALLGVLGGVLLAFLEAVEEPAELALALAQPVGDAQHLADAEGRADGRVVLVVLGALDPLRDLHLAFAREEGDLAHLAQVDPHGIVAVPGAAPVVGGGDRLGDALGFPRPARLDDRHVVLAEVGVELVELRVREEVLGQRVGHVLAGQDAALAARIREELRLHGPELGVGALRRPGLLGLLILGGARSHSGDSFRSLHGAGRTRRPPLPHFDPRLLLEQLGGLRRRGEPHLLGDGQVPHALELPAEPLRGLVHDAARGRRVARGHVLRRAEPPEGRRVEPALEPAEHRARRLAAAGLREGADEGAPRRVLDGVEERRLVELQGARGVIEQRLDELVRADARRRRGSAPGPGRRPRPARRARPRAPRPGRPPPVRPVASASRCSHAPRSAGSSTRASSGTIRRTASARCSGVAQPAATASAIARSSPAGASSTTARRASAPSRARSVSVSSPGGSAPARTRTPEGSRPSRARSAARRPAASPSKSSTTCRARRRSARALDPRQGGAAGGERLLDARAVQRDAIEVALDHHDALAAGDAGERVGQPVEGLALAEHGALRRVQVLRLLAQVNWHFGLVSE